MCLREIVVLLFCMFCSLQMFLGYFEDGGKKLSETLVVLYQQIRLQITEYSSLHQMSAAVGPLNPTQNFVSSFN
jgi:hypothetical protein